jgi:two-component system sensor histidine kinase DesK
MRLLPNDKDIGWVPYVWLVYLVSLPISAWFVPPTLLVWPATLISIAIFLPLYFAGYWLEGRRLLLIIAGIAALGVAGASINPASMVYFVYAGGFAGKLERPASGVQVLGAVLLAVVATTAWFHFPAAFGAYGLVITAVIGSVNLYYGQRHRDRKKLQRAEEEIQQLARIAERERIARDLHDVLGHTLSVIVLKSELASKLSETNPARAASEIKDVELIARDALSQVRTTIQGYHARSLRAEAEQAAAALEAAGVKVHCDFAPADLPATHEGVLALALREAVTNVIRHAKATSCTLRLQSIAGGCQLEIQDNGCGKLNPEGNGLSGMRFRVEALGGKVLREASSGTRLLITLPETSR